MSVSHKVQLHLYLCYYSWSQGAPHYMTSESAELEQNCDENHTYEYIRPVDFEIPRLSDPKEIDVNEFRIRGIRRAQRNLMAKYQKKMTELTGIEQSLLALPNAMESSDDDQPL